MKKTQTKWLLLSWIVLSMTACSSVQDESGDELSEDQALVDPSAEEGSELAENAPEATTDGVPATEDSENPELALADAASQGGGTDAPPAEDGGTPPDMVADAPPDMVADAPPAEDPGFADATPLAQESTPPADAAPVDPAVDPTAADATPIAETPSDAVPLAPVASSGSGQSTGETNEYTFQAGDTLMKVAFENYGDVYRWREIFEANRDRIADPNSVAPGTKLVLSGSGMVTIEKNGEQYLIRSGDTLGLISKQVYGTTQKWRALWENNRQLIKDPNKIYAGFYLYYLPESQLTRMKPLSKDRYTSR